MEKAEFDHFADEYHQLHARNIARSGETPEFFARYKVADVAAALRAQAVAPRQILDFGAGVGNSLPFFHASFPNAALTCADISTRSLEICRTRFPGIPAAYLELEKDRIPLPDDSTDLAFSACVFHHIAADEHLRWLGELRRVVRPGGWLAIFEHNPLNPLTTQAVRDCPFDVHARLIGATLLRERVKSAGWRAPIVRYRIFFPHFLRALRPLERALGWLPMGAQYSIFAHRD